MKHHNVWQYLGLDFTCFRGWNFEAQPRMWDFSPSDPPVRVWEVRPRAPVPGGDNKGTASVRQQREQFRCFEKCLLCYWKASARFLQKALALSLNTRPGSITPRTRLCFLGAQSPTVTLA